MPCIMLIITRFRVGKGALIGEIQKMFWKASTYVFIRVCLGNKPSPPPPPPPIAEESMIKIANAGKESQLEAYKALVDQRELMIL